MTEIGRMFGSYELKELLYEDGVGKVFRGFQVIASKDYLVRVVEAQDYEQRKVAKRVLDVALRQIGISHHRIVPIKDVLEIRNEDDDELQYVVIVAEFPEGEKNLQDIYGEAGKKPEHEHGLKIVRQIIDGVKYAHERRIIHSDLRPAHIFLDEHGDIQINTFGIFSALDELGEARENIPAGSVPFLSPEQLKSQQADRRSDVYGMGALLYFLMTGHHPFATPERELVTLEERLGDINTLPVEPRELNPQLPENLALACLVAMAPERADRFASLTEFGDALVRSNFRMKQTAKLFTTHKGKGVSMVTHSEQLAKKAKEGISLTKNMPRYKAGDLKSREKGHGRDLTIAAILATIVLLALAGIFALAFNWYQQYQEKTRGGQGSVIERPVDERVMDNQPVNPVAAADERRPPEPVRREPIASQPLQPVAQPVEVVELVAVDEQPAVVVIKRNGKSDRGEYENQSAHAEQ